MPANAHRITYLIQNFTEGVAVFTDDLERALAIRFRLQLAGQTVALYQRYEPGQDNRPALISAAYTLVKLADEATRVHQDDATAAVLRRAIAIADLIGPSINEWLDLEEQNGPAFPPDAAIIVAGYDGGGFRDFLAGQPIHAGAAIDLWAQDQWVPGRYELDDHTRTGFFAWRSPSGELERRREIDRDTMRFRWSARR